MSRHPASKVLLLVHQIWSCLYVRSPLILIPHKEFDYSTLYKHGCLSTYNGLVRAIGQAVGRRPYTAEARVPCLGQSLCRICGGKGTGFVLEYFNFPLFISFHQCSILIVHISSMVRNISN